MGAGNNAGRADFFGRIVEVDDGIDGQRRIAGVREVAVPGPERECGARPLPEQVVLQKLRGPAKERPVNVQQRWVFHQGEKVGGLEQLAGANRRLLGVPDGVELALQACKIIAFKHAGDVQPALLQKLLFL